MLALTWAGAGSDETAIQEAVADLQARLEELHSFETIRRQAGLFADHEVDLSAQERAKARLINLAAQRARGLIAGSDQVPEQPDGRVRIRDLAFSHSPQDVPIYILAPARQVTPSGYIDNLTYPKPPSSSKPFYVPTFRMEDVDAATRQLLRQFGYREVDDLMKELAV